MKRNTQQPTVTFQNDNVSSSAEEYEEPDYVNAAVSTENNLPAISAGEEEHVYSKLKEPSADTYASLIIDKNEKSRRPLRLVAAFLGIVCVILIAATIVYALWLKVTNLTTENQQLTTEIHQLTTEIQQLETQRNNLTQQIHDKETERIQSNVTRTQWSVNAYCPIENNRRECQPCQKGWLHKESSCYAFNNPEPPEQKTWTEARGDCGGKGSDLVVIADEAEKRAVSEASFGSSGYWIGLRVENRKWKWVDGSDLNKGLWTEPAVEGHCAILFKNQTWRSVRCSDKNQWICELAALSV